MTPRRVLAALVVIVALAWPARASADGGEVLRLESPSTVVTDGGTELRLPPGYFVPDVTWQRLDAEVVRLQNTETRLEAENRTLRETPPPTRQWWIGAGIGLVAGIVLGAWAL